MRKGRLYRVNENRTSICHDTMCIYFTGNHEVLFLVWYLRGKFFSNKLGAENPEKGLKFFHLS